MPESRLRLPGLYLVLMFLCKQNQLDALFGGTFDARWPACDLRYSYGNM